MAIFDNLKSLRHRIDSAAARAGRDPKSVALVAAVKYASLESVRQVCLSGLADAVAENRVQDAEKRKRELGEAALKVPWRMIGHLQSNKAAKAAALFDSVDTVDSLKIAQALDKAAAQQGKRLSVLLQVKLSAKETQYGVSPWEVGDLLRSIGQLKNLEAGGLMAIAPAVSESEEARPAFKRMRTLFDDFFKDRPQAQLSMGMSGDFEVAVEEGSTMVRLGQTIFSGRAVRGKAYREDNS